MKDLIKIICFVVGLPLYIISWACYGLVDWIWARWIEFNEGWNKHYG